MPEMKSLTLNDKTYDCFVDSVARSQVEATAVIGSVSGSQIAVTDASNYKFVGLNVYGKTTQNGTPTPDAPVDLVNVGDKGSITVNVTNGNDTQSVIISTINGLPGIPVTSGGNYTDAKGQQWICDEIDFARGVHVRRIGSAVLTGGEYYYDYIASAGAVTTGLQHLDKTNFICSHSIAGRTAYWANASAIAFNVSSVGSTTKDEFVAFVAEQYTSGTPIVVVYVLPTPIETPLSEAELAAYAALRTYRDQTTVSNDAGAGMKLEYVMDAKKYIDNLVSGTMHSATVE